MMNDQSPARCPRCGLYNLLTWDQLTDAGREVASRLAQSAEYSLKERQATHRWCVNCWYEEIESKPLDT